MRYNIEADGYNEIYSVEELSKGSVVFVTNTFEEAYYKVKQVDETSIQMKVMKVSFTLDTEDEEVEGVLYDVHIGDEVIGKFKAGVKLSKNQMISSSDFGLAKVVGTTKDEGKNYVEIESVDFEDVQAVYHTNNSFHEHKSFLDWEEAYKEVTQTRSQNIKCWIC